MRPFHHARGITMLHRIEVEVIDASGKTLRVADRVLPEASGPQLPFSISAFVEDDTLFTQADGEIGLDHPQSHGIAVITVGETDDGMQVIRQDHHGADAEGMFRTNPANRCAQVIDVIHECGSRPVGQGDSEEIRPARDAIATVMDHARSMPPRHGLPNQPTPPIRIGKPPP